MSKDFYLFLQLPDVLPHPIPEGFFSFQKRLHILKKLNGGELLMVECITVSILYSEKG